MFSISGYFLELTIRFDSFVCRINSGAAGRYFKRNTKKLSIARITGLVNKQKWFSIENKLHIFACRQDPANPCFKNGQKLDGLSRGDADFVDIVG